MRKLIRGGLLPAASPLCLLLGASATLAQAAVTEPTTAHSSTMQTLTVAHPAGANGYAEVLSYDYFGNAYVYDSTILSGALQEHPIQIRQYTTTEYGFENWGGGWIYDYTNARFSGVMFWVQQPLPGLPARPAEPSFGAPTSYPTPAAPAAIASADLNGDGRLDLITANRDSFSGTTYFNSATTYGTFVSRTDYSVPGSPEAICAANFDGVSRADVCWGGFNSNDLLVAMNNGTGTLGTGTAYGTSTRPKELRAADLNGDGDVDIVKVGQGGLSVHSNNGSGVFTSTFAHNTGFGEGCDVADVDNDGDIDILSVTTDPHTLFIHLNQGGTQGGTAGTFNSTTGVISRAISSFTTNFPRGVIAGDYDGDGVLDVIVGHGAGNQITFWKGTGGGVLANPTVIATPTSHQAMRLAKGDFNNDGKLDVVIVGAGNGSNDVSILSGSGDGTFYDTHSLSSGGSNVQGVIATDLDGNGSPDIAVVAKASNSIRVFRSQ